MAYNPIQLNIEINTQEDGGVSVRASAFKEGEDPGHEVINLLQSTMNALAGGKLTAIRSRPFQYTEQNFETKTHLTRGGMRFTYVNTPGEWKDMDTAVTLPISE